MTLSAGARLPALTVEGPQEVLSALPLFLAGWRGLQRARQAAEVVCVREGQIYRVHASTLPEGGYGAGWAEEAADVMASALAGLAVQARGVILPHAGALESPGGLILLLAETLGGKSTLALSLAAAGWRLFGDDRLGLARAGARSVGIALGLAPKLRLPLPRGADGLTEFARTRIARRWPTVAYLRLRDQEQARPGTRCPVAAALILERNGGPARLEPAGATALVRALAGSAAAPWLNSAAVLAAAMTHAALPVLRLTYAEASEAVPLLRARFGD